MKPHASATWVGGIRRGQGVITTESSFLSQSQYFVSCDGKANGTNPYELLAAAHAACFSMALAHELAGAGFSPQRIDTTVTVTMEPLSTGWTLTAIQLDVLAKVPRAKQGDFIRAALCAKTNCLISRLLKTNISMSAKLENSQNRPQQRGRRGTNSLKVSDTNKQVLVDSPQGHDYTCHVQHNN
jgi:lipoyl-dependent peroxiredoxin